MQMFLVIKQTKKNTEKGHKIVWINRRLIPPIFFQKISSFVKKDEKNVLSKTTVICTARKKCFLVQIHMYFLFFFFFCFIFTTTHHTG